MRKVMKTYSKCYHLLEHRNLSAISWIMRFFLLVISFVLPYQYSLVIGILSGGNTSSLLHSILLIALFMCLKKGFSASLFFAELSIEKDTRIEVKKKLLAHLLSLHPTNNILNHSAKATEVLYSDVNNITSLVFSIWGLINDIIVTILTGYILVMINPILAITMVLILSITLLSSRKFASKLQIQNKEIRLDTDQNFKSMRDILLNMKSIKTTNAANYFLLTFSKEVDQIKNKIVKRDKTSWGANLIGTIMENIGTIVFLLIGGNLVLRGSMSLPNFILFSSYSSLFNSAITRLFKFNANIQHLLVSIDRVFEHFEHEDQWKGTEILPEIQTISLLDVHFKYQYTPVIQNMTWQFKKGNCYYIVGNNGSGKTTLLDILAGVLCPLYGKVLYNNRSISNISYQCIQAQVSFFSQEDVIFDISIMDNLLLFDGGEKVPLDDVKAVCKELAISEAILSLPNGYNTVISDIYKMSYGQKRKILLSRAFLKPADVVLLDEPLSGLDQASQSDIVKAIKTLCRNKLVIVATHRMNLFGFADEKHCIDLALMYNNRQLKALPDIE